MINIKYTENYDYIEASGHSNFAPRGHDLICAGVSCIVYGLCNYLHYVYNIEDEYITIENGYTKVDLKSALKHKLYFGDPKDIIFFVVFQLKTMEQVYGDFIKIEEIKKND